MKNLSYLLLFALLFQQGCGSPRIYKKTKITRTVSKVLNLNFSVNQIGDFKTLTFLDNRDIISLFEQESENISISSSTIDKIDVKGVKIGADVLPANTAAQVVLSADILSGALLETVNPILNKTKTITISQNTGFDFGNALGNAIGSDDETTLYNAITILNADGTAQLKKVLESNLSGINRGGLTIRLNGTVPANQRLVMKLTIAIDASITFSRCEEVEVFNTNEAINSCN